MISTPARPLALGLVLGLGLALLAPDGLGQVGDPWFPAEAFVAGNLPTAGHVADVNGDGHLDVVTGNLVKPELSVMLGRGDGTLVLPRALQAPSGIQQVGAGDVDGDGRDDLVALVGGGFGAHPLVVVAYGTPDGAFGEAQLHSSVVVVNEDLPQAMALGDVDGDGRLDVVVLGRGGVAGPHGVLLRGGVDGLSAPEPLPVPQDGRVVALVDLDGDGILDLLSGHARQWASRLFVFLGDGSGGFASAGSIPVQDEPRALLVGDLDDDGQDDAVLVTGVGAQGSEVLPLLGDGRGALRPMAPVPSTLGPDGAFLAQLDDDGRLDLCLAAGLGVDQQRVELWRGDGAGGFALHDEAVIASLIVVGLGDLDEDGLPDLVSAQSQDSTDVVAVRRGTGAPGFDGEQNLPGAQSAVRDLAVADTTGDGLDDLLVAASDGTLDLHVGGSGLTSVLEHDLGAGVRAVDTADVDGDGTLDAAVVLAEQDAVFSVLGGLGPAGFGAPVAAEGPVFDVTAVDVALGDLTNDGRPDAVSAVMPLPFVGSVVGVWPGSGELLYGDPVFTDAAWATSQLELADMNGDGDLDVVRTGANPPSLIVMPGRGDGTFGNQSTQFLTGSFGASFDLGDVTEDGWLDVVLHHFGANDLYVFPGKPGGGFEPWTRRELAVEGGRPWLVDLDLDEHLDLVLAGRGLVQVLQGFGDGEFAPERLHQVRRGVQLSVAGRFDGGAYPDIVSVGSSAFATGALVRLGNRASPWVDLGHGLPGPGGAPVLWGAGPAQLGAPFLLGWQGPPGALALLVLGGGLAQVPFQGGVLVPAPDLVVPVPPSLSLDHTWDDDLPVGLVVVLQVWFDAAGVVSATNGLGLQLES